MAKNLQKKLPPTDTLLVQDINSEATMRFASEVSNNGGAEVKIANTPAEASNGSETVVTVLPEPVHIKGVFAEIMAVPATSGHSHKDRLFIDCSTIDPNTSSEVAKLVSTAQQGTFVDAPMSGGVVGATAGTLTFMLGAPSSILPIVEPILLKMGKRVLHCGDQTAGLVGKLANNYLLAINNIATAEAMNLGIKAGLDPKVLANVINVSTGKCWPSEVNNPVAGVVEGAPAGRDYSGGFGISLMKKDLGLAIEAAKTAGAQLELGAKANEVYTNAANDEKCKGRDFSVVYRYLGGKE